VKATPVAEGTTPSLALVALGAVAGVLSGLFGIGGGIVIVPLLVLWLEYQEREATATSLAAIGLIAGVAAAVQAIYGNVNPGYAALVGVPALAGVVTGAAVQQRIIQLLNS